jgi:biopolymer transport protein ExbD
MPKIKLPTKSPTVDMTPMVDLFSLLLTFFMLTATVRVSEPAPVDTPTSVSEKPTPDFNQMTFVISKDSRVFFNIDNGPDTGYAFRPKILAEMGKQYGIEFTDEELRKFQKGTVSMGVPIEKMKEFLNTRDLKEKDALQTGIPIDSLNNQLASWILYARKINGAVQATIKGDGNAEIPIVMKVLDILQDKNVNRFNLITNLEANTVKETEAKTQK